MNRLGIGLIVSALVLFGANAMADNIGTIEGYASGTLVTLDSAPVITFIGSQPGTFGGHTYTTWGIFAQDSTGAVDLYGALPAGTTEPTPTVGDTVNAAGTWSPYHAIPEIGSMTSLTHVSTASLPTPPVFTIPQLNITTPLPNNIAGYVFQLQNVTIYTDSGATTPASGTWPGANTAYYVKDSGGNIMEMYFWYTSYAADGAMVGNTIPTGPVNITAFASQTTGFAGEITPLAFSAVVPEPTTIVLVGVGLAGLLALRRRRD